MGIELKVEFFEPHSLSAEKKSDKLDGLADGYKYSVILAFYNQKIVMCRHKERSTWELAGGHIEAGETPLQAAKRELFEETGATEFTIRPISDYSVQRDGKSDCGMLFLAEVTAFQDLPNSEMAEIAFFDELPDNLTYPSIQAKMYECYCALNGGYKVITLCGSTKFKNEFISAQRDLTLKGNIVISVGMFDHTDGEFQGELTEEVKIMLDDMHKRKIDMANEIFVINKNGYIGSSTRSEIEYAEGIGKKVVYLENV